MTDLSARENDLKLQGYSLLSLPINENGVKMVKSIQEWWKGYSTDKLPPEQQEHMNGIKTKNNSPNQAIVIVGTIQGLSSTIDRELEALRKYALSTEQEQAVKDADEQMDLFNRVDVSRLREVFG